MDQEIYKRVRNNPKYTELIKKRKNLAWSLSIAIFAVYYSFIMLIAFSPETLAKPIGSYVTTIGIPLGLLIIVFCIFLTRIYIGKANSEFDSLIDEIKDDIRFDA